MTGIMFMLLPLLFTLLLVFAVFKILKMLTNRIKIRWTPKYILVVVTGYITLGLLAFLYMNFFYEPEITTLSNEDIRKSEQITEKLQGDYSSFLTDTYKKKSWQYEFEGDVLSVDVNERDIGYNFDILLRYNDNIEKGKVILSYYQTPVIVEGLDLTDETSPPNTYMSGQQLMIGPASEHSVEFNRVDASLSILEFNRSGPDERTTMSYYQPNVLLIEVARSTNIEDLQSLINIIN